MHSVLNMVRGREEYMGNGNESGLRLPLGRGTRVK